MKSETYNCPVCKAEMREFPGDALNVRNGLTVYCASHTCPAQEVSGHGRTAKEAYEIVEDKFLHGPGTSAS
jgi:hypothetical protein